MEQLVIKIGIALFLALVSERLVAAFIAPIWERLKWDKFYLIFPGWIIGGALAWLSGLNLFGSILPDLSPLAGQILTCVIVGGGSNLIHDIFDKPPVLEIPGELLEAKPAPPDPAVDQLEENVKHLNDWKPA